MADAAQPADPADPANRATLAVEFIAAAAAIQALAAGQRLAPSIALATQQHKLPVRSRAAVQDISFATVRRLGWADAMAAQLNRKAPAEPLLSLQRVALVQLDASNLVSRHPAVIVDQAVKAANQLVKNANQLAPASKAASFINATLRRFLRERDNLNLRLADLPQAQHNFPAWWLTQLQADYPKDWRAIVAASNHAAPLTLRVNRRQCGRDRYLEQLAQAGIVAAPLGQDGIVLPKSLDVTRLPGYREGLFSVQDGGAQVAAYLLDLRDGQRVLDACAAPGGKAAHILERSDVQLTALDSDPTRLARVQDNLNRLRLTAHLATADAGDPSRWWDGVAFDRILLDAPCSASGIVRRHPDVRWLRQRGDIATLCRLQRRLLDALWPLLTLGGKLLYATCSVFRAEGADTVAAFVAAHSDSVLQPLHWNWTTGMSLSASQARALDASAVSAIGQWLPSQSAAAVTTSGQRGFVRDHDGFFYALLEKAA